MVAFSRKGREGRKEEVEKLRALQCLPKALSVCSVAKRRKGTLLGSGGAQMVGAQKGGESHIAQAFWRRERGTLNGLPDGRPARPSAAFRPVGGLSFVSGEWVNATVEAESERQLHAIPRAGGFLV